jgi:outer membrane protein assembly factor BamB
MGTEMPGRRKAYCRIGGRAVLAILVFISSTALLAVGQIAVTTYHYDNNRTGWNQNETVLTPANVGGSSFGLLQTVALDDQVDAQPLVVPGVQITAGKSQGLHDVVYVATEGNTVYAIDANTGAVLLSPNFGTPVSSPLGCNNNGPNVGITSTPVIDPDSKTLYAMAYIQGSTGPAYYLHALDLGSLTDKVPSHLVKASHTLTDGSTFNFNATYQRQRPALLLANGSIYAGFGSFCDLAPDLSRGWLLGWTAGSLKPFPSNDLTNQLVTSRNGFFLSSIWMAGYGPASDDAGNILLVTGNSDPAGNTYDGVTNIQESVVKVSSTLTTVLDLFTPKNVAALDAIDADFGSGGVLVLPDQPGSTPHLAVAAGKAGTMFLMNEDKLGGFSPNKNAVLASYAVGRCWCGPSYFVDPSDGVARVVSSGGRQARVWKLQTSPKVTLTQVTESPSLGGGQDPGFFTTISSNGTAGPIIWGLSRPPNTSKLSPVYLFAFDPESGGSTMKQLFKGNAGAWPNVGGDANLVPVVANGQVFVASNQQLQIFGIKK